MRLHRVPARRSQEQRPEAGFSLLEVVTAITVIFGALLMLLSTALTGLTEAALSRQRQTANGIANQILEQVRALPYETVGQGLDETRLPQDPNVVACPDGDYYFKDCPSADPAAEKIVHSAGLADVTPLVPNKGTLGAPAYPNTFTWRSYVTKALGVPQAGAYRVTAIVSWNLTARQGVSNAVRNQTLIYRPGGTTDPSTGSGTFFQGTSDLARGSVKVAPNSGVSGGTGVSGLPSWDSITQDLSALSTDVTAQALTRSDSNVTLDGARKSLGGVPAEVGGASSVANADDYPDTALTTSSTPPGLSQGATPTEITGGGNRVGAGELAASGAPACPTTPPTLEHLTGYEHGTVGVASTSGVSNITVDSTQAHSGSYSMRVNKGSGFSESTGVERTYYSNGTGNLPQAPVKVVHFALMFEALPAADVDRFFSLSGAANANGAIIGYQASSKKLTLRFQQSGGPVATSASPISAGGWYVIDLRYDAADGTPAMDWQINGVAQTPIAYSTGTSAETISIGSLTSTDVFTIRIDDLATSATASNYPLPDLKVFGLRPNGMGTNVNPAYFQHEDGNAVGPTSWQRLDDLPLPTSNSDYVKQVTASGTSYLELTFEDTAETCILGAIARAGVNGSGSQNNNAKTSVFDASAERIVHSGLHGGTSPTYRRLTITPASSPWTQAAVNGLKLRIGYGSDVNPVPYWQAVHLEYAVISGGGGGGGGPNGSHVGASAATVPSASPLACFASQASGACSYSQQGYSSSPPSLQTLVNLAGSGAGDCMLYKRTADVGASSAYGRRDTTANPTGSVVEDVVHYYGTHELGGLCAGTVSPPAGWPGYLVRYDPGGASSCVKAAAGLQAPFPKFCSVGTISYWNGSGVSTMSPPSAGASIPVANLVNYTSNGWRYDITATLASNPSSYTQVPANAPLVGTADRTEAKAVLGAPVAGKITYKLTNTTTGNVVVDLTMDVDLGSLTATAVYKP